MLYNIGNIYSYKVNLLGTIPLWTAMEAYVTLLRTQVFSIGNKEGLPRLVVMAKVSADYGCSVETETHTGWNNTIKYGGKKPFYPMQPQKSLLATYKS